MHLLTRLLSPPAAAARVAAAVQEPLTAKSTVVHATSGAERSGGTASTSAPAAVSLASIHANAADGC